MSLSLETSCNNNNNNSNIINNNSNNNNSNEPGASLLTYDCHRTVPAPFLTKTYLLVDDPATDDIVSWGEDETTFVVWRPPEFARDLLPNYFKHNNFSSFVRQLNTYGFRKIVPDHWEFANKYFRRGEKQLLCEIHRRKSSQNGSGTTSDAPGSQSTSPTNSGEDQAWSPFPSPLSSPSTILIPQGVSTFMSDENERLRHDNRMLLLELSRLRRLYDDLVVILQQQSKISLQELPSPLRRLHILTDHKLNSSISEQIEAAARRSEQKTLNRFSTTTKDGTMTTATPTASPSPSITTANTNARLRPPSVESASCMNLLARRADSATPKASTLSFLDGKLREIASNSSPKLTAGASLPEADCSPLPSKASAAPKLFGVSLNNRTVTPPCTAWQAISTLPTISPSIGHQKRPRASSWGPDRVRELVEVADPAGTTTSTCGSDCNGERERDEIGHEHVGKSLKVELGLELRSRREPADHEQPSSSGLGEGQPWLRISGASCPERVFM